MPGVSTAGRMRPPHNVRRRHSNWMSTPILDGAAHRSLTRVSYRVYASVCPASSPAARRFSEVEMFKGRRRSVGHPALHPLVPGVWAEPARSDGDDGRAWRRQTPSFVERCLSFMSIPT